MTRQTLFSFKRTSMSIVQLCSEIVHRLIKVIICLHVSDQYEEISSKMIGSNLVFRAVDRGQCSPNIGR
jgi:hypothetical protein